MKPAELGLDPVDLVGKVVTAKPFGWDDAQENNKLDFPDPAIPTMIGVPEWITGVLEVSKVVVPEAHINYTSYEIVDVDADIAWEIDPATIKTPEGNYDRLD